MTSLPKDIMLRAASFGSTPASSSVREAIASYRRSQYFLANSNLTSSEDEGNVGDEEACFLSEEEEEEEPLDDTPADGMVSSLQWDEDEVATPRPRGGDETPRPFFTVPVKPRKGTALQIAASPPTASAQETTPLLRKTISFSSIPRPRRESETQELSPRRSSHRSARPTTLAHRTSSGTLRSVKYDFGGKSTFGQTLFNAIAILIGIGMLSEPMAFAYAGWIGGTFLIIFYGYITCYTAKILAHIILDDPRLRSYADIGRKTFGPKSMPLTSAMFCMELFAVSVALVTLYADSLHTIVPTYSANAYKILGLLVMIPTVFMPLSLLSYTSVLGIVSTLFLIAVIFIDGTTKKESPGSLWDPAPTDLSVGNFGELGVSFGLFMAGLSGHAVIPSLARDMVDPGEFDTMINWAFFLATLMYAMIGGAGYLMFGRDVQDEISKDLLNTVGFNPLLNKVALWMLVINPLSKFALATRPLNITLEIMLGIETHPPHTSPEDHNTKHDSVHHHHHQHRRLLIKRILTIVERIAFTLLSVGVSIMVPEFSSVMAFLGSFSAFLLCVIGPVSAKVALAGRCGPWDALLLIVSIVMATWGTIAAFWSADEVGL
ncbi:hypothetical protein JAAARDRAFT_29847 [Jaapia argillacea MUCL 33604]|uniref:Amino acid transporter transmembrane domain-containing protein n=1 Tax=Jaapia argillacea MUCL 33604 TaxID=933084 RepID=A0A067QCB6_9AGAM|nr:hypothetical protein JAAARDRAFT_29847 [Jaapia argillacea MUCL 33604]